MSLNKSRASVFIITSWTVCLLLSASSQALDKSRLWLPSKYRDLMPALIDAAEQAEATRRCQWVINGEMNVQRSTDEEHIFTITCRDESHHSYLLTYQHQAGSHQTQLLSEQGKAKPRAATIDEQSNQAQLTPSIDANTALEICSEAVATQTDEMGVVVFPDTQAKEVKSDQNGFFFRFLFDVSGVLGNNVRYRADCRVDNTESVNVEVFLEPAGALALCFDNLKEETLLMRHVAVNKEPLEAAIRDNGDFYNVVEFTTKSRRGSPIRYTAQCTVRPDGDANVTIVLDKSGALAICKDTLRSEAIALKGLQVIDEQVTEVQEDTAGFHYQMPFNALIPGAEQGLFLAKCHVDIDGTAEVNFRIDEKAVVPMCTDKLRQNTRTMIDVVVLEQADIDIEQKGEEFLAAVPFNAKSPMGQTLHYRADCRVNSIGVTSVAISARSK